ncbi:MAG: nicotinate (nicotinamide) nucleotide adenylyltransferase [Ruminococcaceae bacterium]|nr:nicotinate (nicotinamide) nucleotide adenylyltransferase [Oscillospiraceae bacterium]
MKKMGLFGGSFDPIHQGHIEMVLRLADTLGLDGILLMPTFVPPHKIRESMASADHRLAMCRLAAKGHPKLQVSDLELTREGASFTVDTLKTLCEQYPDTKWYLITGADMFVTLRTWYRFDEIARLAVLCTVPREGTDTVALFAYADALRAEGAECYVDPKPVLTVSSTDVRCRAMRGESLTGLVPEAVAQYVAEQGLYRQETGMKTRTQDEQFIEIIRTRLSDYRFRHSLCVAKEARRLALRYGADADKAYTAGILHDIMKDTPKETQQQLLAQYGAVLDPVEQNSPTLWHARSGEVFLRHILGVTDEELLRSVRYHTTGRAGMTLLEQVLFVADFTSADRDYPDVEVMRRKADTSLSEAMQYGVEYTIRDLVGAHRAVHPDTVALYNDIVLSGDKEAKL